jgi:hypothetical protein
MRGTRAARSRKAQEPHVGAHRRAPYGFGSVCVRGLGGIACESLRLRFEIKNCFMHMKRS